MINEHTKIEIEISEESRILPMTPGSKTHHLGEFLCKERCRVPSKLKTYIKGLFH